MVDESSVDRAFETDSLYPGAPSKQPHDVETAEVSIHLQVDGLDEGRSAAGEQVCSLSVAQLPRINPVPRQMGVVGEMTGVGPSHSEGGALPAAVDSLHSESITPWQTLNGSREELIG